MLASSLLERAEVVTVDATAHAINIGPVCFTEQSKNKSSVITADSGTGHTETGHAVRQHGAVIVRGNHDALLIPSLLLIHNASLTHSPVAAIGNYC